jgi:hypothetical protein
LHSFIGNIYPIVPETPPRRYYSSNFIAFPREDVNPWVLASRREGKPRKLAPWVDLFLISDRCASELGKAMSHQRSKGMTNKVVGLQFGDCWFAPKLAN